MVEGSPNGGWRDTREYNGLERELEIEDPTISPILADGADDFEEEYIELGSDGWGMYHLSKDLDQLYQETGEYWILQVNQNKLEPVMKIDDEKIVLDSVYDPDNTELSHDQGQGNELTAHPANLIKNIEDSIELFSGKDYEVTDIQQIPYIDGSISAKDRSIMNDIETERLNGSYIFPDSQEDYREFAENEINRMFKE